METKETKLGEILRRKGLISSDQLRDVLMVQRAGDERLMMRPGEKLGKVLLAKGYVAPMELVRVLCEQKSNIDFILIGNYLVEPMVVTVVSEHVE